ncbi:hypothetical protein NP493_1818g00000, partial [Ridgeia piscesae]
GIGYAIAKALAAGGAETYALSRTQADLDRLKAEVVAEGMISRGKGGAIVNISSIGSRIAFPNLVSICASKGALEMITKMMTLELGPHQLCYVNVNMLHTL